MSIGRRIALLFRVKASKLLDHTEDPREVLDYSYQRQLEMLAQVRRGLADVTTSRKRIQLQENQLRQAADRLQEQARQAVFQNRDDLAREDLTRRAATLTQLEQLRPQYDELAAQEQKFTVASQRLQAKVEAFRTRKETIKATYTSAEAQSKIGEAVTGISEELGDVGLAIQRAEDKTRPAEFTRAGPRRVDRFGRPRGRDRTGSARPRTCQNLGWPSRTWTRPTPSPPDAARAVRSSLSAPD